MKQKGKGAEAEGAGQYCEGESGSSHAQKLKKMLMNIMIVGVGVVIPSMLSNAASLQPFLVPHFLYSHLQHLQIRVHNSAPSPCNSFINHLIN